MSFKFPQSSNQGHLLNGGSELRKRFDRRHSDSTENLSDEAGGELSDISDDEDIPGCPLPSTPEDNELLEAEVSSQLVETFQISQQRSHDPTFNSNYIFHVTRISDFTIRYLLFSMLLTDERSPESWRIVR